jgi:protein-ribulosamine 3-kinase
LFDLSNSVLARARAALVAAGDDGQLRSIRRVTGGFESQAARLTTARGSYFLKWRPDGRFVAEAADLDRLRATGTVRVPTVLAAADATPDKPGFLLQEWLRPPSHDQFLRRTGDRLGAQVASLHAAPIASLLPLGEGQDEGATQVPHPSGTHSYPGPLPAGEGTWDWPARYVADYLEPAAARGAAAGRMPPERRRALDRLYARLDDLLGPVASQPSLLHGDLHRGNVLCDADGELVLIDPHPRVGDREAELAYTEWVGGFPPRFYAAYEAAFPSQPGRAERRDLYLVWFLLGCLARGELRQGLAVDALLRWRVGPS